MTKEPTREDVLKEIKRRKRKDFGKYGDMCEAFLQMAGVFSQLELARVCDLSRTTVYKYIDLLEK